MHKILDPTLQFVFFFPIPTNSDNLTACFVNGYDVGELNSRRFAIFARVLKAQNVQIDVELEQKDLFGLPRGLDSKDFVRVHADLGRICVLILFHNLNVAVFPRYHTLFELVGIHRNTVRDPRTLRHDTRTGVRDV